MTSRAALLLVLAVAVALVAAGCGSDGGSIDERTAAGNDEVETIDGRADADSPDGADAEVDGPDASGDDRDAAERDGDLDDGGDGDLAEGDDGEGDGGEGDPPTGTDGLDLGGLQLGPLTPCTEIPVMAPSVLGDLPDMVNLDHEVSGVVVTYARARPETFAGWWLDRDHGGVIVLAVTDDPAPHLAALLALGPTEDDLEMISPRPPISDPRPLGERDDVAIDVVQARFTEQELLEAQPTAHADRSLGVTTSGFDVRRNRVEIGLVDPTQEQLDRLAEELEIEKFCVAIRINRPIPTGPLDVIPGVGEDVMLTCGGNESFPASALDEPLSVFETDHPAAQAFIEEVDSLPELPANDSDLPPGGDDWILLSVDGDMAFFARYADGQFGATISMREGAAGWRIVAWSGGCRLLPRLPHGFGRVAVYLDPERPLDPDSSTLHLLVQERRCASGLEMGERLLGPELIEGDDEVVIAFVAAPTRDGVSTCQATPITPVTVELSAPLGERVVVDGLRYPRAPLVEPDRP